MVKPYYIHYYFTIAYAISAVSVCQTAFDLTAIVFFLTESI